MLTGQILLQLIVILIVVQIFGFLCRQMSQPWVIGEILAGLALGPSLLGALSPGMKSFLFPLSTMPMLQTLGDIGLVLYMFSLGTRLDTHLMLRQGRIAVVTAISGIFLPLILGATLAFFLFPSLGGSNATLVSFMLIVGTAMAITAFPVLARLLTERKMLLTRIGALAVYCMGETWHDALSLGILMNTRGLVGLIVLNIGLDLGVLSPTMFAMLVMMALVTTMIASPLLPLLGYKQRLSQDIKSESITSSLS